ncbi:centrosomal protein of 55 kDa-like [Myxocyprinus asiaticus]|uniref:centrosomal protein of 55 kDa-like n=1 Tax=Myxocyprinus asiaticus TaxID=70543 RepID=UPI0022235AD1|nr:centrosomal protein of 55 kDa-like [Myxocyprinus asiaticus]
MAAKGAKETLVNKLGFKSNNSSKSVEIEMEKLKRENHQLKKSLEQIKRNGKQQHTHSDSDRAKLLERILALETLREKNSQQLLGKDQEISSLRHQLRASHGEMASSLLNQLDQKQQEAEQREIQFQALSKETEDLKNKFCAVSERCDALEKQKSNLQVPSGELAVVQDQLRDALEKNHNWLVYDQQREAYVQGVLARIKELETQFYEASQALQLYKEANSDGQSGQVAQHELETERARASRIQAELDNLRGRYEEKSREATQAREQLLEERRSGREAVLEERSCSAERSTRLQSELETVNSRLEEERKRVAELMLQVNLLQKSLNQQEEHNRIALLEQQIHLSARESENEKLDRQTLQQQLHKVLKELRKARDQITRLESSKQQRESRFSEPSTYNRTDFERLTVQDRTTSPSKVHNILDESILECPNCGASYPTSQHRELLAHLDYCFS